MTMAPGIVSGAAIVEAASVSVETWKNPNQGRVVVLKMDHRGELTREEMVRPEATFTITPAERALNQQLAYSPEVDMFTNGTLAPVQLLEGSDIAAAVAANPNLLSEREMHTLVTAAATEPPDVAALAQAFAERLGSIANATTLRRLLDLAITDDAAYSRVTAIQRRLAEVEGPGYEADVAEASIPERTAEATEAMARRRGGVTPR